MFSHRVGLILGRDVTHRLLKCFHLLYLVSELLINAVISSELCSMQLGINNKKSMFVNDIYVLIETRTIIRISVYFYYHVLVFLYTLLFPLGEKKCGRVLARTLEVPHQKVTKVPFLMHILMEKKYIEGLSFNISPCMNLLNMR